MTTDTSAPTPTTTNPGMLAMRAANMCKRLGLQARDAGTPKPASKPASKPATRVQAARKQATPKPESAPDEPETLRKYRVVVLVEAGEAQTHKHVDVDAAGPRRAGRMARAALAQQGHVTIAVAACLSEDCPQALWKAAACA